MFACKVMRRAAPCAGDAREKDTSLNITRQADAAGRRCRVPWVVLPCRLIFYGVQERQGPKDVVLKTLSTIAAAQLAVLPFSGQSAGILTVLPADLSNVYIILLYL